MFRYRFVLHLICLLSIPSIFLSATQPIIPCKDNTYEHRKAKVAICMMFQNEAPYLKEWLEYHKLIGVEHFYLYDNASNDGYWEVLKPYVKSGLVELFYVKRPTNDVKKHTVLQRACYKHAFDRAKDSNKWIATIDSDEFICMPGHDDIREFLKHYKKTGGLAVNWVMYGSSWIEDLLPGDLQIEHLIYRAKDHHSEHFMFKSISQVKHTRYLGIHHTHCKKGKKLVFANKEPVSKRPSFSAPPIGLIRINHYWWRTEKYFREVKQPRRANWHSRYSPEEVERKRAVYNAVPDISMARFVEKVKKRVKRSM